MIKRQRNKAVRKGFLAWIKEHVRPSVTFSQSGSEGGPPKLEASSLGQWIDYATEKAKFWIKFRFRF